MAALKDLQYMEKADTDMSFSSLLSIKVTLSSLKAAQWFWHKNIHTHKLYRQPLSLSRLVSSNTEPNPQCQHRGLPCVFRWSLMATLSFALSLFRLLSQHFFFQFPPTHPLSSSRRRARLCFERMRHHWWRSHPTHQQ